MSRPKRIPTEEMTECCASAINRKDAYPQAFYFVGCDCGKTWAVRHTITTQLVRALSEPTTTSST